jgi:glycosyltransferase involved in cell wall biosynthesis
VNIAIFTRNLSHVMGGMERQLLSIASGYCDRGHKVLVVSLDAKPGETFFASDPRILFVGINIGIASRKATFKERFRRQVYVYKFLGSEKIDVSIAFMTGSFWYSAIPSRLKGKPIVLAERNGPTIYKKTRVRKINWLIFASMLMASSITVQFASYIKSYPTYLRSRIIVIPNQIPIFENLRRETSSEFRFIFAGRLSNQKQINELVQAFIQFHAKNLNTRLDIFGDGEQKNNVLDLINKGKAEKYIFLHPPTKIIQEALAHADVMVAPSLWEGFPNSVAEALAYGVPVGGFDDCEGVRDLIVSGKNGWLISRRDSVRSQVELLETIYRERNLLSRFSVEAEKSVLEYQGEAPNHCWEKLTRNLTAL